MKRPYIIMVLLTMLLCACGGSSSGGDDERIAEDEKLNWGGNWDEKNWR